ncbi:MAG: cytochrome c [Comamonadaceae bacterium]
MKYVVLLAFAALTSSLASTANAQFRTPEAAIKYRQSVMTVQGRAFYGSIGAMVNGRAPYDARAAAESAELVLMLSKLPWIAFGPGTDKGAATDAKPSIWSEPAKFKDLADKMQAEVVKLAAAAKTGNPDSLKAAYGPARDACKACHDAYTTQ